MKPSQLPPVDWLTSAYLPHSQQTAHATYRLACIQEPTSYVARLGAVCSLTTAPSCR